MKKQLLFILGAAALSFNSLAQDRDPNLIPCATYEAMDLEFKKDPTAKAKYELFKAQFEIEYQKELQKINQNARVAAPIYTIPVVFHIMGNLNITDQAFITLVNYINNDYARTGSDISTINPAFSGIYVDSEIRFALAKRDPNGNCTNGIIRHDNDNPYWSQSAPAYNYSGTGTNRWPTNQYLNIYIVECISSATYPCPTVSGAYIGGYTYLPGSPKPTNGDAIVMLRNQVAVTQPKDSRTLSHEIGHWLNLSHTFGSSNNPGTGTCGSAALNDNVADTPETKGYFSTCPTTFSGDCSALPNVENIMDYSSCPKMFTQGQTTRMRTALTSATAGRNNLWSAANLIATGITPGYTCTPVANFEANKLFNCTGNAFTFTSTSEVGSSGSVSWSFPGGTPATSTATSQVVTYANAGVYTVSLTATNGNGTDIETKVSYINVVNGNGGVTVPSTIDFEGSALPSNIGITNGNSGSVTWAQNASVGANSTSKSIFLNNAPVSGTGGNIDFFETPVYNFSNTSGISLSYYYSYAKRLSTQADTIKVQYSLDCGGSWTNIIGAPTAAVMATSGGTTTTPLVPTASQWVLKTTSGSLLNVLANKPSVKFRWWFKSDITVGRSNNFYIDQINLTGSIVTGITELESSMGLSIYPNPTNSTAIIDFSVSEDQKVKISVADIMGRVLEQNDNVSTTDGNVKYTINQNGKLASGIYIVNIDVNGQRVSKKLIIE